MAGSKMREAAVSYAEKHGFAVFVTPYGEKDPYSGSHGFYDATSNPLEVISLFSIKPNSNIALSCGAPSGNVVVIDVDNKNGKDGSGSLRDWELEHGDLPETVTCCTPTGGYHYYYRVDREIRPSTNDELGIDIRGDGSYVMLPPSVHPDTNTEYVWEFDPNETEIADANDLVYELVKYVQSPENGGSGTNSATKKVDASTFNEGGRNNQLFKMACSFMSQSWPDNAVESSIMAYNKSFDNPLPDNEVRKIIKSALKLPRGKSEEYYRGELDNQSGETAMQRFNHVTVAQELLGKYGACYLDGAPAVYDGMRYRIGWDAIERAVISIRPNATQKNRNEVRDYLRIMMPNESAAPSKFIAFTNGVLDVETMDLMSLTPELRIPNVIPHDFDEDARSDVMDKTLARISCNDPFIEHNLCEFMGLCMLRDSKYGYSAILLGKQGDNASNGKSTYIRMLANILGKENYSSLDLGIIAKRFQALQLMGKLANLGDDIGNEFVKGNDLALVKKIITGEDVYTDVKGTKGLTFVPYCTLVFSANRFPKLGDDSEGVMRRLFPIRFNAKFSPKDPDFDPDISKKLAEETAVQAAISRGVLGLRRVIENRRPTPNSDSENIVHEIKVDNCSLLQWLEDNDMVRDDLIGWETSYAYERYKTWCDKSGVKNPYGKPSFGREVADKLNFKTVVERRDGRPMRVYSER